jgi:hypothetical protein
VGVIELFDRGAALFPDRACLVEQSLTRSYRDVRGGRSASRPGCRFVILPAVAWRRCTVLGIFRARLVYAPVNACAHPAESVHILNYCGHDPVNSAART